MDSQNIKKIALKLLIVVIAILAVITIVLCCYMSGIHLSSKVVLDSADLDNNSDIITIVTSNIRGITNNDANQTAWYNRAPRYTKVIGSIKPDILCTQETTKWQINYVQHALKGYDHETKFSDSGYSSGSSTIFYNTNKFRKIDSFSFWVSETPKVESKGWDAACYRVCLGLVLEQISNGKQFIVLDTHLDHIGSIARTEGMKLIQERISTLSLPCILCGDMNTTKYSTMYDTATLTMDDSRIVAVNSDEDNETFHGYDPWDCGSAIDFIFCTKNQFDVLDYKIIKDTVNGFYISDHYPVRVELKLK